jgi:hypothetical protein
MTYPDGIDALVNVNAGDTLAAGGHAARHNSTNTALAEVRNFLASGSANTVLTAGSVVPTWDLVDPASIANGTAGYVLTAGSAVPAWAPLATSGKVLQIVRATDGTRRSTTSTTAVDASLSVTITPQKSDSTILLIHSSRLLAGNAAYILVAVTDSSNNTLNGFQATGSSASGHDTPSLYMAYATPATIDPTTYKVRFQVNAAVSGSILNDLYTGQLYAIEVAA